MDMAMRSFIVAGVLALVLATAGATWWAVSFFGSSSAETGPSIRDYGDRNEGDLYDEFGEGSSSEGRITIRTGDSILDTGVFNRPLDLEGDRTSGSRFGGGPQFDWSGSRWSGSSDADTANLPRGTPAERVEADCRRRGGGSYACRCLVRLARTDLSEPEFEFLSLAEEFEPRKERLGRVGLEARDLSSLSAKLIALDAGAQRRCGAGLTR